MGKSEFGMTWEVLFEGTGRMKSLRDVHFQGKLGLGLWKLFSEGRQNKICQVDSLELSAGWSRCDKKSQSEMNRYTSCRT